jgi:ABC-2 type transport system ATP-binding protein
MQRRLDLAVSLVVERPVVFLDEPTAGLDPRSRREVWDVVRRLGDGGTTILLTTQYLEEADRLAERIVLVDHGRVIAEGTPEDLKQRVGGSVCEVRVPDVSARERAAAVLRDGMSGVAIADGSITVPAAETGVMADVIRRLDAAGVEAEDLALRRPTLDDVFLALTGHVTGPTDDNGAS